MSSDNTSDCCIMYLFKIVFPNVFTILNIFQQQRVGNSRIAKQYRFAEVNAAGVFNFLNELVVAHFRATSLTKHIDLAVYDRNYRFNVKHTTGKSDSL